MTWEKPICDRTIRILDRSGASRKLLENGICSLFVLRVVSTKSDAASVHMLVWRQFEILDAAYWVQVSIVYLLSCSPGLAEQFALFRDCVQKPGALISQGFSFILDGLFGTWVEVVLLPIQKLCDSSYGRTVSYTHLRAHET